MVLQLLRGGATWAVCVRMCVCMCWNCYHIYSFNIQAMENALIKKKKLIIYYLTWKISTRCYVKK